MANTISGSCLVYQLFILSQSLKDLKPFLHTGYKKSPLRACYVNLESLRVQATTDIIRTAKLSNASATMLLFITIITEARIPLCACTFHVLLVLGMTKRSGSSNLCSLQHLMIYVNKILFIFTKNFTKKPAYKTWKFEIFYKNSKFF